MAEKQGLHQGEGQDEAGEAAGPIFQGALVLTEKDLVDYVVKLAQLPTVYETLTYSLAHWLLKLIKIYCQKCTF